MDARLTDEQLMLQKVAADIAAALAPASVDDLDRPGPAARSAESGHWAVLVDAGLVALRHPPDLSGPMASVVEVALVAEQLAGPPTAVPFVGQGAWVPELLAAAGAADALEAVTAGDLRLAPVLRPDLGGLAGAGEAGVAFDAHEATVGLVIDSDGGLAAVELGEPTRGVDLTRMLRRVAPDATAVDMPLGGEVTEVQRCEATALAVLAADLLGTAQRALDDAVGYVSDRVQFGVAVGSFQAVQHMAAHAAMLVEGARSSVWHAAWAVDELPPAAAILAARQAKAAAATAARQVGETAIQMLGGIGLTWEHFAHVRQRRILLTRRVLGDEDAQHTAIADERLGRGAI